MNFLSKANNNLLTYTLVSIMFIYVFGINFFIRFVGNILLLLFLIPVLLLLLFFVGINFYKSKIITCSNCGLTSLNLSETCINCGSNLEIISKRSKVEKPSDRTIEVEAEEIR